MTPPTAALLLLDKPPGLSSNAALQRVRRLAGGCKAGHTGTLDPLASGMLPICLGEATKLAGELLIGRKAYTFGLQLGERSSTGDAEGEIIERLPVPLLDAPAIRAVLARFLGELSQLPPMYSALKHDGQPLYRLARQGIEVERSPRTVQIYVLQLTDHSSDRLTLTTLCSKGTYVRVLAEDLARALGTCGRLFALRRDYVEPFSHQPMHSLESLETLTREGRPWPLLAPDRAVSHLPPLTLSDSDALALRHGQRVPVTVDGGPLWRLYDADGAFLGLGESVPGRVLQVRRLFSAPVAV